MDSGEGAAGVPLRSASNSASVAVLVQPAGVAERIADEAAFVARAPPELRERLLVVPVLTQGFHTGSSCRESARISHWSWNRLAARFTIWHLASEIITIALRLCPVRKRAQVRCTIRTSIAAWEGLDPKCSRAPQLMKIPPSACVPAPPEYDRGESDARTHGGALRAT